MRAKSLGARCPVPEWVNVECRFLNQFEGLHVISYVVINFPYKITPVRIYSLLKLIFLL